MVKINTTRLFEHTNGYGDGQFIITAEANDKKIVKFSIEFTETPRPKLLFLLADDLHKFATIVEETLNGK